MWTLLLLAVLFLQQPSEEALEWFAKGEALIGTELEYSAQQADYFAKAAELAPDYAPAHFNLVLIYLRQQELERALQHCQQLVALEPDGRRGRHMLARVMFLMGRLDEAARDLVALLGSNAKDHESWDLLGQIRYQQHRYGEAVEAFQRVVELRPSEDTVYLSLAFAQHRGGLQPQAETSYQRFLRHHPNDFDAHFFLALLYRQQKRNEEALKHLLEAERIRPDDLDAIKELGDLYLELGHLEDSDRLLKRLPQDSAVTLSNLGIIASRQADLQTAADYFGRALKLEPESALIWGYLGDVLVDLEKKGEALAAYQEANRLDPEDFNTLLNLGSLLANLNQPAEAKTYLESAIALEPSSGIAQFRLGIVLERLQQPEAALRKYELALEQGTDVALLHFRLAILYARAERTSEALHHLESSFQKDAARYVPIILEELRAVRSDLDSIRYTPQFQQLLEHYRPDP